MNGVNSEKEVLIPETNLHIIIDPDGYVFGQESIELAAFVPAKRYRRAADLGSGDGVIAMLIAAHKSIEEIWAIELDPSACDRASRSIKRNQLDGIIQIHQGDVRKLRTIFQKASFDLVVMNPPFFTRKQDYPCRNASEEAARQESTADLPRFLQAARYLLKTGSDLIMLYHPLRFDHLILELDRAGFTLKDITFLHHRDGRALFVLTRSTAGGKPGVTVHAPFYLSESIKHRILEEES